MVETDRINRRRFMEGAWTMTVGSIALAGCSGDGGGDSNSTPDLGGWLSDAKNYDGTVADNTGSDTVTVKVGAGESSLAFDPAAIRISSGTEVRWKWTGKGGEHNVHATEGASFQSDRYIEAGVHFTHTVDETNTVKYQCDPHSTVGMKGVVIVE